MARADPAGLSIIGLNHWDHLQFSSCGCTRASLIVVVVVEVVLVCILVAQTRCQPNSGQLRITRARYGNVAPVRVLHARKTIDQNQRGSIQPLSSSCHFRLVPEAARLVKV